ncbi:MULTISPECIES: hypothetical protein [unclassified Streptomyces]|uniref:hypothetical protein n=1 Tax=unclassified Streptomyces TaxID=2593676 RepID=UPI0005A6F0AC|nr:MULTISPECIES: hypothetical protein [unclassified Streptomyces]ODA70956.1 hypothetical protein APS67_004814 [Streptomyces sp. AVP053U2]
MEAAAASPVVGVPLGGAAFAGVGTRPTARRGFTRKVTRRATAVCAAPAGVLSLFVLVFPARRRSARSRVARPLTRDGLRPSRPPRSSVGSQRPYPWRA